MAFLQCVGSRDKNHCNNEYCSSVCCMYAIKEAMSAKEADPGVEVVIFHTDMRTHGKALIAPAIWLVLRWDAAELEKMFKRKQS